MEETPKPCAIKVSSMIILEKHNFLLLRQVLYAPVNVVVPNV